MDASKVREAEEQGQHLRVDEEGVTRTLSDGTVESVRWADLAAVTIMTTADGPFAEDVFWLLVGEGLRSGCVVPQGLGSAVNLLERLQALPGFDNEAVIAAMQCCEEAKFLCWERSWAEKAA